MKHFYTLLGAFFLIQPILVIGQENQLDNKINVKKIDFFLSGMSQETEMLNVRSGDIIKAEADYIISRRKSLLAKILKGGSLLLSVKQAKDIASGSGKNNQTPDAIKWQLPLEVGIIVSADKLIPGKVDKSFIVYEEYNVEKQLMSYEKIDALKLSTKSFEKKISVNGFIKIRFINGIKNPIDNGHMLVSIIREDNPVHLETANKTGRVAKADVISEKREITYMINNPVNFSITKTSIDKIYIEMEHLIEKRDIYTRKIAYKNSKETKISTITNEEDVSERKNPVPSRQNTRKNSNKKLPYSSLPTRNQPSRNIPLLAILHKRDPWFDENEESEKNNDDIYNDPIRPGLNSDSYSWIGAIPDYSLPEVIITSSSRPLPEPAPPDATPSWYSYEDPETGYGGGNDEIYALSNPCNKQRETNTTTTANFISGLHNSDFVNLANSAGAGGGNEMGMSMGWRKEYIDNDGNYLYVRGTLPGGDATPNSIELEYVDQNLMIDSAVHTHPFNSLLALSPADVFFTLTATTNNAGYQATFSIGVSSQPYQISQVFALVVNDRAAAMSFLQANPRSSTINSAGDFIDGTAFKIDLERAKTSFMKEQGFSEDAAYANALAFVLEKYNTGISLLKKGSDNQFHSLNTQKITDFLGNSYFITRNC